MALRGLVDTLHVPSRAIFSACVTCKARLHRCGIWRASQCSRSLDNQNHLSALLGTRVLSTEAG